MQFYFECIVQVALKHILYNTYVSYMNMFDIHLYLNIGKHWVKHTVTIQNGYLTYGAKQKGGLLLKGIQVAAVDVFKEFPPPKGSFGF